jgi:hypothetical protein
MFKKSPATACVVLFAVVVAGSILVSTARAQSAQGHEKPAAPAAKPLAAAPYRNQSSRLPKKAALYYETVWGVDSLAVKWTESGELIRFSYRVVDPEKAKALNDKNAEPSLIDPQAGVKLVVPQMEKIGSLRQSSTPEAGKSYWMAFSNSGRPVKRGHRVDVVIGQFRAQGLIVD